MHLAVEPGTFAWVKVWKEKLDGNLVMDLGEGVIEGYDVDGVSLSGYVWYEGNP